MAAVQSVTYIRYPEPYWRRSEDSWVKSLLLVFDSVAILLPRYMRDRLNELEWLSGPLVERGLLQVLEPETFVDRDVTDRLGEVLVDLIADGLFDDLDRDGPFAELSMSRLGGTADVEIMEFLVDELKSRGLARSTEDGVSIPMHPAVRTTVLLLLAQLAPARGRALGLNLQPVTGDLLRVAAFRDLFQDRVPSSGRVVAADLETIGVDVSSVPLDEIVAFRSSNLHQYQAYMRDLRSFVHDMSVAADEERTAMLQDRQAELAQRASELASRARLAWRKPFARVAVGAAGAAWTLKTGDPAAGVFGAAAALLEYDIASDDIGPFSYLLSIDRHHW